jgi:hypothetical protein
MKFKNYPREYEYVFSDQLRNKKKCDPEKVRVYGDDMWGVEVYSKIFAKELLDFYRDTFDHLVKIVWLSRRFCYNGNRRTKQGGNGFQLDGAFSIFSRDKLNYGTKILFASNSQFTKISTYLDDFYPDFDTSNPFESTYEYPFRYMLLPHLLVVYQMSERLELLREGELKKMSLSEFMDYVVNYISCYNAEHGETYKFVFRPTNIPHVAPI